MSAVLLRLLAIVLFGWQPMEFAAELTVTMPSLHFRGPAAVAELIVHGAVAALSAAAGWSLWHARPHGPSLAKSALVAIGITAVQSLYGSTLPSQTQPGTEPVLAFIAIVHAAIWLFFLSVSARVRSMSGGERVV